jgi:hypothetical protein
VDVVLGVATAVLVLVRATLLARIVAPPRRRGLGK